MGQLEAFVGVNPWTALFTLLNTLTIFFVAKKFLFEKRGDDADAPAFYLFRHKYTVKNKSGSWSFMENMVQSD